MTQLISFIPVANLIYQGVKTAKHCKEYQTESNVPAETLIAKIHTLKKFNVIGTYIRRVAIVQLIIAVATFIFATYFSILFPILPIICISALALSLIQMMVSKCYSNKHKTLIEDREKGCVRLIRREAEDLSNVNSNTNVILDNDFHTLKLIDRLKHFTPILTGLRKLVEAIHQKTIQNRREVEDANASTPMKEALQTYEISMRLTITRLNFMKSACCDDSPSSRETSVKDLQDILKSPLHINNLYLAERISLIEPGSTEAICSLLIKHIPII